LREVTIWYYEDLPALYVWEFFNFFYKLNILLLWPTLSRVFSHLICSLGIKNDSFRNVIPRGWFRKQVFSVWVNQKHKIREEKIWSKLHLDFWKNTPKVLNSRLELDLIPFYFKNICTQRHAVCSFNLSFQASRDQIDSTKNICCIIWNLYFFFTKMPYTYL